jgi:aflatoxin B1 aldehyde reductase
VLIPRQGQLGDFIRSNYHSSDALTNAIVHVQSTAEANGLSGHEVALRWVKYHSALKPELGDAMIVGASSPAQLESTMKGLAAGPLPKEVVEAVDGVWESAMETAPDYSPFMTSTTW